MLTTPDFIYGVSTGMFIAVMLYTIFDATFGTWRK